MNNKLIQQIRCLITLLFMLCLSLSPGKAYSQDAATVTLSLENVEMRVAMNEIEKQTKFLFVSPENIDLSRLVSVKVENRPLREALEQMTAKTDIAWQIKAPSIFLSEKKPEAPVTVTGKVSDAAGMPVVGASVVVRGTNAGVSTGADGSFSLLVPPPAQQRQLEINFLGYEPVVVAVGGRTVFDITLSESASEIEQVVVTALGIKRSEKALSYNVQQVNSEDILAVKDANFINSLTGKVAGLTINTSSSGVGGASKVVLRGNKSISQSSNALYVIDGIPMYNFGGGGGTEFDSRGATESIADINPEDIESMSVLNGAAAAALYGSEAANGAIMITTKKGQ